MVPEGWRQVPLAELVTFKSGGTPSTQNPDYWGGEIPWISAKDLTSFRLSDSQLKVTILGVQSGTRLVPEGTVLILVRGMTLHKDVPVGLTTRPMTFNQDVRALIPENGVSPEFLAYSLVASKQRLRGFVDTAGHGTGRLASDFLQELPILLPPTHEQSSITRYLTAWDRAITQMEKLIEAKRKLKKGLMQQLITGKWRFPEFNSAQWPEAQLGAVAEVNPRCIHTLDPSDLVTFLAMSDVAEGGGIAGRQVRTLGDVSNGYTAFRENDILVAKITPCFENYKGTIATDLINGHGFGSTEFHVLRTSKEVNARFIYYLTMSYPFRRRGAANMTGSAGQKRVSANFLRTYRFGLPPISEQKRIAAMLDKVEHEIKDWTRFLILLTEQKRGLMQKLLTGQIRVEATDRV